jgi:hypothetical protein
MNPMSYETLDAFMARVRKANATGGRNITLTIGEAADLSAAIGQLFLRQAAILENVTKPASDDVIELHVNGGSFK